jgi:dihydropteroate synthase
LDAGAEVVNDISALGDEGMTDIVADKQAHVVLMHMQGTPQDMQIAPHYTDVCAEVLAFLQARAAYAEHHGVSQDKIWLDVGIGFGKTSAHNLALLRDMAMWKDVPYPLVMGLSRKRFLGDWINEPCAQERDFATVAACLAVYQQRRRGIIFRVHNVRALEQAFRVWQHFALPCE